MLFVANHVPSNEVTCALEGNFFSPGSTVILSSNTIYLFYPATKLVKQKFFYEKILQIEKHSLPDKDLLVLLFTNSKISYIYFDKEKNEFVTYKLKFYETQSEFTYLRKGKYNYLIKLNKHEYSFLDEKEIYQFKKTDKQIKNIRDILVSDSIIKCFYVLCNNDLFFVTKNGYEKYSFDDECLYFVKNENFICVVGKYNFYLIKNKIIFKIRGNRFKVNYLNEKIIECIKQSNIDENTIIKSKESTLTEENDEFSKVYETNKVKSQIEETIIKENIIYDGMNINIDFSLCSVTSKNEFIYIIDNNHLYTLKVSSDNHRINYITYQYKALPFSIKVNYFTTIQEKLLINDYLFDKNLCSFNKFFTNEITFLPTNLEQNKVTNSKFILNFDKILTVKNEENLTIKEIHMVNAFHAGNNLTIVQNNIVYWYDLQTLEILCYADFNNFDQKINLKKYSSEIDQSFIQPKEIEENFLIKEILSNDEFIILRTDLQLFLYRIINDEFFRITNNTLPIFSDNSFYETKNFVFIKSKPMIFFKKCNFIIKKIEFSFDDVIYENDLLIKNKKCFKIQEKIKKNSQEQRKVEKELIVFKDEREGVIKIVSENAIFYREKIKDIHEEEEEIDENLIELGAKTKRFIVQYFTKRKKEELFINEIELLENEFVTSAKVMKLNDLQSENGKSDFIVVTTSFVKSEEGVCRGRLLIFEIVNVVPEEQKLWTDKKLKLLAVEKCRGSVLDCCEVRGYVACCISTRLFIYKLDRNEGINAIAFHDANILCVKVKSIKNYLIVGDLNGVFFFYFQLYPTKIHLLSFEQCYTTDLQLLIHKNSLFIIVKDIKTLKVFTYSPYNLLSKAGKYLIKRNEIDLLVNYSVNVLESDLMLYQRILDNISFTGGFDLKLSLLDSDEIITKKMCINEVFYEFINFSRSKINEVKELKEVINDLRSIL